MSEKENILARVREALKLSAPFPGEHAHAHPATPGGAGVHPVRFSPRPASTHARQWLPAVGEGFDAQAELFRTNSLDLKTDFQMLNGEGELSSAVERLRDANGWRRVAYHETPLTAIAVSALSLPALNTDPGYAAENLESCDVGITECDALVAQTGSVLITARSAGGRGLSVLPPHHLVIARRSQLVPDLPSAFELLAKKYAGNYPSFISFITGPSRTGDIERILVLGAHGPKQLTVLCL